MGSSTTPNAPQEATGLRDDEKQPTNPNVEVPSIEEMEMMCGPLLNYRGMHKDPSGSNIWYGSVLIVTKPGHRTPELRLRRSRPVRLGGSSDVNANAELENSNITKEQSSRGEKLFADPQKQFWRFLIQLPILSTETCWEYSVADVKYASEKDVRKSPTTRQFIVPSAHQSMRMMFHSCNGFSVGTDEEAWSGPALWNDVLRVHESKPFHVMIGGGDQIYNDGVRVNGPLKSWTDIGNPQKRRDYPFGEDLRSQCDQYYVDNYIRWFSTEPFASANAQIPQINIWDDHDIIDGFGSYADYFMRCAVFRGIGGISYKYYCLFQQHISPPISTYTTDSAQTTHAQVSGSAGADPAQTKDTFVLHDELQDPMWIIGKNPGPYVEECSRSIYLRLGSRISFVGIDARTERTRHQVNYIETYDLIFKRLESELSSSPEVKHLILLLGVPIAYPRLVWLENVFKSPIIGPIRFLSRRFGVAGGLFNKFDGQVDLLDDLDDHYTARQHKKERKALILRLQALSLKFGVRVTILGGDVHLAALGRFYSKPNLHIPVQNDHRYMTNIISSAITNKPPPKAVANLLARRNKIHHLNKETDETLMKLFDKDPGDAEKTSKSNHCTMPSRNYAIMTETPIHNDAAGSAQNGFAVNAVTAPTVNGISEVKSSYTDGHSFLHGGEEGAGTKHVAASGIHVGTLPGGLDVSIRVEIDQHDHKGKTEGYGFSIPAMQGHKTLKDLPAT